MLTKVVWVDWCAV